MAVREDLHGRLVEKAATVFDLSSPLAIKPKTAMVETTYGSRDAMPERVELQNVAFEGFMVRREVVERIGLPDPSYFIFYDDVDFAVRARRAGYRIWAVRDAVLVRQLDFDQQHDLSGWKGFYMYRNLFVVHFRYGENLLVRLKPYLIVLAVVLLAPVRGGRAEAANVTRAIRSARGMRHVPAVAEPSGRPPVDRLAGGPWRPASPNPGVCVEPRSRRRRLRPVRTDDRRTLCQRARPEGPGGRAAAPHRRQRLQRGRPGDRDRDARLRRAPLPHLEPEGVGLRQPVHLVHELPAPGVRPVRRAGLLAADEPRADQPVLREDAHPRRGAHPDRRAGERDRHRRRRRTSRRRRSAWSGARSTRRSSRATPPSSGRPTRPG